MTFQFRRFQTRLTFFFVSLLIAVLTLTKIAVNKASIDNTRQEINTALEVSTDVFRSQISDNIQKLLEIARLLSSDFAFKAAYSTHDHDTILSAMENHLARIEGSNVMMLTTLDGTIIAHTRNPKLSGAKNPWPDLQARAEKDEYGETADIVLIDDQPYQMMVVPLLIPDLDAWIYIGFPIDNVFAEKIRNITRTAVTVLHRSQITGDWKTDSTSLLPSEADSLLAATENFTFESKTTSVIVLDNDEYVSMPIRLNRSESDQPVIVILQRSLDKALAPYKRLRLVLFVLFTISLFSSAFVAWLIAKKVTRPVLLLTQGVEAIKSGNYQQQIQIPLKDEIGTLATSFNSMAKGLAEKEKVQNLLGKVVSPAIAEELLSKDIELGGEERFVTTLFSDVRNFTALCEGRAPAEILSLLNEYFTSVSGVIENNGGVVDKYIGDAIMALFGAPLQHHDDAYRAVKSAYEMVAALDTLNQNFINRGIAPLSIGIGINSDIVVAGNMGSTTRLNYTVIGDGVNLASRIEGLTKFYGVNIIVSESTAHATPDFVYRELDRVKVKGKTKPCIIYEPICPQEQVTESILQSLQNYHDALALYYQKEWLQAKQKFTELLVKQPQSRIIEIYLERSEQYLNNPPDTDWDGTVSFNTK